MQRYWGLHYGFPTCSELHSLQGKTLLYPDVPLDRRMLVGDYVFLFWNDESLYGWGTIHALGEKKDNLTRDVTVFHSLVQPQMASVNDDIRSNRLFENYERLKDGPLSSFNDDQVHYLNQLCRRGGLSPPDPDQVREEATSGLGLRPVIAEFVLGRKLAVEETRFDEFKEIFSKDVVGKILSEVEKYIVAFLNLEDRREEDICRIIWGVRDKDRVVVGVKADSEVRDRIRRDVSNELAGIQPPLASSARYVEIHVVKDESGSVVDDLVIIEVGVGYGEKRELYCSKGKSFYIKEDAAIRKLGGQLLVAEIRRRVKAELKNGYRGQTLNRADRK